MGDAQPFAHIIKQTNAQKSMDTLLFTSSRDPAPLCGSRVLWFLALQVRADVNAIGFSRISIELGGAPLVCVNVLSNHTFPCVGRARVSRWTCQFPSTKIGCVRRWLKQDAILGSFSGPKCRTSAASYAATHTQLLQESPTRETTNKFQFWASLGR